MSYWNSAQRCNSGSPLSPGFQRIQVARLRPLRKQGGVVEMLEITLFHSLLIITNRKQYTTNSFTRSSEEAISQTNPTIDAGNQDRAVKLMLSDLKLQIKSRNPHEIIFAPTESRDPDIPSMLHPYMPTTSNYAVMYQSPPRVGYSRESTSNDGFRRLSKNDIENLLNQLISSLEQKGWYLVCNGRRQASISLTGKTLPLTTMAKRELLRHGTSEQRREWAGISNTHKQPAVRRRRRSPSNSSSSSSSSSSSDGNSSSDYSSGSESDSNYL